MSTPQKNSQPDNAKPVYPPTPTTPETELSDQRIMIKDIQRLAKLIGDTLKSDEIIEMLSEFSTAPDKSMTDDLEPCLGHARCDVHEALQTKVSASMSDDRTESDSHYPDIMSRPLRETSGTRTPCKMELIDSHVEALERGMSTRPEDGNDPSALDAQDTSGV
ncbi:hypothetical protein FB45DRAFT_1041878 [Roridomyces roridus]|uniref:Uncharacterized protein n=1 Tax=Roridomyces roridus TaxID=1738132 RepID=A0AAD7AZV5_9AGAR|nr:hypothetical protein FB45DRAFT_1041878 [Roridomyces roridus]